MNNLQNNPQTNLQTTYILIGMKKSNIEKYNTTGSSINKLLRRCSREIIFKFRKFNITKRDTRYNLKYYKYIGYDCIRFIEPSEIMCRFHILRLICCGVELCANCADIKLINNTLRKPMHGICDYCNEISFVYRVNNIRQFRPTDTIMNRYNDIINIK